MSTRDEPKHRMTVDRELVLFHYEHNVRHAGPPAAISTIVRRKMGASHYELALLSSVSGKHRALYCLRRDPKTGYRFRRLHPELEGDALAAAVDTVDPARPSVLVELGLSYAEIESVTGLDRKELGKALRRI